MNKAYRDPVGVLLSDFLAFSLPLLENVVFFVLKLHLASTVVRLGTKNWTKLDANDAGTTILMNGNDRGTTAVQTQYSCYTVTTMTIYIAISGRRGTGFVIFVGYGLAGWRRQLIAGHTNRRPETIRTQLATADDGRPPTAVGPSSDRPLRAKPPESEVRTLKGRRKSVDILTLRLPELRGFTADPLGKHGSRLLRSSDDTVMIGEISLFPFVVP